MRMPHFVDSPTDDPPPHRTDAPAIDAVRALQIDDQQRSPGRPNASRSTRKTWIAAGVVLAVAALSTAAWLGARPRPRAVHVVTVAAAGATPRGTLTAGGYVRHARIVNVVARLSGAITSLRVAEGDVVRKGDLIATLDSRELADQVAEVRADVEARVLDAERAGRERERSKVLADEGVLAVQAFERADTESRVSRKAAAAARARLARASELLDRAKVRAPIAGRVLRKYLDVGSVVSFGLPYAEGYSTLAAGSPIVSIGQLEALEATADVSQTDLGRVTVGGPVEVRADAFPGRSWRAHVLRFSPRADRNKNTVEVTVRFDEPAPTELAQDMSVKLSFLAVEAPLAAAERTVPASAVLTSAGGHAVFVVEGGRARRRPVVVGAPKGEQVPVKDGLVDGEVVVVSQLEWLKDGTAVVPEGATANGDSRE